jgi:hypothetical protein
MSKLIRILSNDAWRSTYLIVKECISILDKDDGATHHSELLLEHFGVE